ncbi:restriction endonuclease [Acinetobacter sp. V89_7]|uniref:restriction endonuclease n=1 Tax=Acinetobacter sp. V89_7 TaxID=3044233 RepID=UPI00249EFA4C|nr:restriction endonuclease [Acinetobacter sp. V89_7]MDI3379275.1 restriction endonuclease [Acinetobacter sp. V89_7]
MSNIQVFQDAFTVSFPVDVAEMVLSRIEMIHGADFQKLYGHLSNDELTQLACTVLDGISPVELKRGIQRMNTEKWCPKLPEFRSWCVQAGDWWTADQAWAKALNFINDSSLPMTTLAKAAFDEVKHILDNEGQKAAHYAFKDIYQDYLAQAQKKGKTQEMWVKPEKPKAISTTRKTVPCPPEVLSQLKGINKFSNQLNAVCEVRNG